MLSQNSQQIHAILSSLPDTKMNGLKRLFWEELNYDHANLPIQTADWDEELRNKFAEPPVLFATAANEDAFHIIYARLANEKMSITLERAIITRLVKEHPHSLVVFSNASQNHWHFVNTIYEKDEKAQRRRIIRRISVSKEDRLRTASERIALLDTSLAQQDLFGLDPFTLQRQHEQAFDVEAVTEQFFNEYKGVFSALLAELERQTGDRAWAHDFALQFLNRLMFLYYIERKRWLGDDPDFLHNYWRAYRTNHREPDSFVSKWLEILFFEAFNKKFSAGRSDISEIPEKFRNALQLAPWLNGGLFTKNELDTRRPYRIQDAMVERILNFLNRYNFTISEDTPLDQEVAVDPEMIGKVYESLVNVSSETDEQGDAGIFYTPRIEIDLMCRLALVDWLANHLPDVQKSVLYEFVFAFDPEDKVAADQELTRLNLWSTVDRLLNELTVLDPACGSGSFLVGMLLILDDLLARCAAALNREELPYDRRKRIVGNSLYGVDIMEWAVHVAELRLWLQLVIDTEINPHELQFKPLLPNLSFKIRRGDSLVQEIGGINLGRQRSGGQLPRSLAGKINALKSEKMKYFNNAEDRKYRTLQEVQQDERLLFREIIEAELQSKINRQDELKLALAPATNLFGEVQNPQIRLDTVLKKQELEQVNESIEKLRQALQIVKSTSTIPFVWDISFVEIFEGEKGGFDIVIGNPPYVRQEKIHDPALPAAQVTKENKREYKDKLARAVYATYPQTFGYRPASGKAAWSLDKKSDYYIYFYFICLSLLNEKGSFCFITSNSWLDVGYGADLQRFLLTRSQIKLILDNQVKRSFKSADVNTIIALLAPPRDQKEDRKGSLDHQARFVMFKVPFENGLSPILWEEVEDARDRAATPETRIVVKTQAELLASGMDPEKGVYAGDKWGGKFLRAPDLFWKIIDKQILISIEPQIGEVCTVSWSRLGINSQLFTTISSANTIPVFKSPRDSSKIILTRKEATHYLKYGLLNPEQLLYSPILWDDIHGNRHICRFNKDYLPFAHNFHGIKICIPDNEKLVCALLNSTLTWFLIEILGRKSLGGGAIRLLVNDLKKLELLINPDSIDPQLKMKIIDAFNILSKRDVLNVDKEILIDSTGRLIIKDDRKLLDDLVFEIIGLKDEEKLELYALTLQYATDRGKKSKGD